jgi:hypothetical protein
VCCNIDLFTHGLLSPALSSRGGEGVSLGALL